MFGRRKPTISADLRTWIEDSFYWADETFGSDWSGSRQLITPTREFFTAGSGQTPDVAQHIADNIAALIPVKPVTVAPLQDLPDEYRHTYQATAQIGGLYYHDDAQPFIQYRESLMRQPIVFINTMTHELMHDRLAPYIDDMPGGEGAHELSTDLHCITHGFGIFALQGPALVGWSGYMTQESRSFALALFLKRMQIAPDDALQYLYPRPHKALRKALRERETL